MTAEEPTLQDMWRTLEDVSQTQRNMLQAQQDMSRTLQEVSRTQRDMSQAQQDMWRLLGSMNRRFGERFDVLERQLVAVDTRVATVEARVTAGEAKVIVAMGALRESIEARDFRLDDHGRRLTALEEKLP
jgi:hypothetical protein